MKHFYHFSVMWDEVLRMLGTSSDLFVDATLGLGGHSWLMLKNSPESLKVLGIDRDPQVLELARENLSEFKDRIVLEHGSFNSIPAIMLKNGFRSCSAILMDLGLSSFQITSQDRGFSFYNDGPLDMRMDTTQELTAEYVVNEYPQQKIADILFYNGDERKSRQIAEAIVRHRKNKPVKTTLELAEIVRKVVGKTGKIHPATRTFQAIRMEVNSEKEQLTSGLLGAVRMLAKGGKICVISFHSGEDRIVKETFRQCQKDGILEILTKKPLTPGAKEMEENPPSRSAKMRVAVKN